MSWRDWFRSAPGLIADHSKSKQHLETLALVEYYREHGLKPALVNEAGQAIAACDCELKEQFEIR